MQWSDELYFSAVSYDIRDSVMKMIRVDLHRPMHYLHPVISPTATSWPHLRWPREPSALKIKHVQVDKTLKTKIWKKPHQFYDPDAANTSQPNKERHCKKQRWRWILMFLGDATFWHLLTLYITGVGYLSVVLVKIMWHNSIIIPVTQSKATPPGL